MVFGFGFNKAKVLASAERNVKQGKLNHAIADYEKITQQDPKDLNILNTLGDLYARAGQIEQATACFKRVGDQYAGEGFTVKAIAMYKKLTKHNSRDSNGLIKLAELYIQQGLYNEARLQYTAVADHFLAHNEPESAALVLQKTMEFDPHNPQLQGRLADVFLKLGKPSEARDLLFRLAQNLRARGALDACDQALGRALAIDPNFAQAVLLRGQVKLEADDAQGAVRCLETLPDIDSRVEALSCLFRAHLKLGNRAESEPLARKLLQVHNDSGGIFAFCQLLANLGEYDAVLAMYTEYSDCLLAADTAAVLALLQSLISRVKNNAPALESLRLLFQRAGSVASVAEVTELLAHAYVQEGALEKARDLYQQLSEMEPDNPLHAQNFRQIAAKLGGPAVVEPSAEPARTSEALLDQLEDASPSLEQNYSTSLRNTIREALTDSELFASYNLPARAVAPLEAMLPQAPDDVELNHRLASLYARLQRDADAARCCEVLAKAYGQTGDETQRRRYAELAAQYRQRAGIPGDVPSHLSLCAEEKSAEEAGPHAQPDHELEVGEQAGAFSESVGAGASGSDIGAFSTAAIIAGALEQAPAATTDSTITPAITTEASANVGAPEAGTPQTGVQDHGAQDGQGSGAQDHDVPWGDEPESLAHEIDLSEEWERMATGAELAPAIPAAEGIEFDHRDAGAPAVAASQPAVDGSKLKAAGEVSPGSELGEGRPPVQNSTIPASPDAATDAALGGLIEEAQFYISQEMWGEAHATLARAESTFPSAPVLAQLRAKIPAGAQNAPVEASLAAEVSLSSAHAHPAGLLAASVAEASASSRFEVAAGAEPFVEGPANSPAIEFPGPAEPSTPVGEPVELLDTTHLGVSDQSSLSPLPGRNKSPDRPPSQAEMQEEKDGAEGHDLEPVLLPSSELPAHQPAFPVAAASVASSLHEANGDPLGDLALSPESNLAGIVGSAEIGAPGGDVASPPFSLPGLADTAPTGEPDFALSELFAEFKHDMEEAHAGEAEDPETHYNLGVAFKEMGLLDEAIGELQKVCMAVEHGAAFPQVLQAYTWLAHCFVEKGIPEAGAGWYEKALGLQALGKEQALAVRYELACAQQAAGNLAAARQHFMYVLSLNIDYRDVTERIKALKS